MPGCSHVLLLMSGDSPFFPPFPPPMTMYFTRARLSNTTVSVLRWRKTGRVTGVGSGGLPSPHKYIKNDSQIIGVGGQGVCLGRVDFVPALQKSWLEEVQIQKQSKEIGLSKLGIITAKLYLYILSLSLMAGFALFVQRYRVVCSCSKQEVCMFLGS